MRACIAGWGSAVPEQRLTNADLERRVDTTDQWIRERTGIRERRVAGPGETTASLAIEAGAAAIKHAGITPDAIDLLVLATASPEQLIPHTGAFVGDGLGGYLTLFLAGFLATEMWRWLGLAAGSRLDVGGAPFRWVRAVATALVSGLVARMVLFPAGALAEVALLVRLVAFAGGVALFLLFRRNVAAGVGAGAALLMVAQLVGT